MYLIDTNVLIWILRGKPEYLQWLQSIQELPIFISTITIAEIYKNVLPSELVQTEFVLNGFSVLNVTGSVAKQAGLYWQQFSKKFKNLHILDCIIAATAKENGLKLITLNVRHFPMTDITLYKGKLTA